MTLYHFLIYFISHTAGIDIGNYMNLSCHIINDIYNCSEYQGHVQQAGWPFDAEPFKAWKKAVENPKSLTSAKLFKSKQADHI